MGKHSKPIPTWVRPTLAAVTSGLIVAGVTAIIGLASPSGLAATSPEDLWKPTVVPTSTATAPSSTGAATPSPAASELGSELRGSEAFSTTSSVPPSSAKKPVSSPVTRPLSPAVDTRKSSPPSTKLTTSVPTGNSSGRALTPCQLSVSACFSSGGVDFDTPVIDRAKELSGWEE